MKYRSIVIISLLLCTLLAGCQKSQELVQNPQITETPPVISTTEVTFEWKVEYPGKISSMVEISLYADMVEATRFGSEAMSNFNDFSATATGLTPATQYYYRYVIWNPSFNYESKSKPFTTNAGTPNVKTVEVSDLTCTTAKVSADVIDGNGSSVKERGVCWGTNVIPTINDDHAPNGSGTGNYSVSLSELLPGQTYCVRAYAINDVGTAYGDTLSFTTVEALLPTVNTSSVVDVEWRTAMCGGEVSNEGGVTVTERGVCWNTSHNPEVSDNYAENGTGTGDFSVEMSGLVAGTTYYVRAYAKNYAGVGYGDEVSFTTKAPELPLVNTDSEVSVSYNVARCNGNVAFDGGLDVTDRGVCWSTNHNPVITDSHASGENGMGSYSVTMTGLNQLTTYYVRAYATNSLGTSYGSEVSFKTLPTPPEGATCAVFSVASGRRMYFSQGNLQYRASDGEWRFAEHQYDIAGNNNKYISSSYNGWIDLFGWGTSGWDSGANCYQPWSTSTSYEDYYPGGSCSNSLTGDYANADWGVYNAISNGGNQAGVWRTLTLDEWKYLFNYRVTSSGIIYAKAIVNNVNGIILLPDNWSSGCFSLNSPNMENVDFTSNIISADQWLVLEQFGAVFLPGAGSRYNASVNSHGVSGHYWSSTSGGSNGYSGYLFFKDSDVWQRSSQRFYGSSVRLVRSGQ